MRFLGRSVRTRWVTAALVAAGATLLACTVYLLVDVRDMPGVNVRLELAKSLLSLITALVITGGVSYAITRRMQHRAENLTRLNALTSVLQELKSAYEDMSRVRGALRAHVSGKTFEEQMEGFMKSRTRLQRIERDGTLSEEGLEEVAGAVSKMVAYTRGASEFYRKNYDAIALHALREDSLREQYRRGDIDLHELPKLDVKTLKKAQFLETLLGEHSQWRNSTFASSYDCAQEGLSTAIRIAREDVKRGRRRASARQLDATAAISERR